LAPRLLPLGGVTSKLIAVRQVSAEGKRIPVLLFLCAEGRGYARCLLAADDTPIVDGPTPEAAFALVEELLEGMLSARALLST
jgi:hypothetical protein